MRNMEFEIVHSVVATSVTMLTLRLMGSVLLLSVAAWAITVGMRNRRPGSNCAPTATISLQSVAFHSLDVHRSCS